MEILITGAGGFIGNRLIEKLLDKGHKIRCLVRSERAMNQLKKFPVELIKGDITEQETLHEAFRGVDYVYHMAANAHPSIVKPYSVYHKTNVVGTTNVLNMCVRYGIKKVLIMSSIAATGPSRDGKPLNESSARKPITNYGKSKKLVEDITEQYSINHDLDYVIIRPPFVYGVGDKDWVGFFRMIKNHKPSFPGFPVPGKHLNKLDFCYVDNLVQGLIQAMESKKTSGKTYFLSDSYSYKIKEIIESVCSFYNIKYPEKKWPVTLSYALAYVFEVLGRVFRFDPPLAVKDVKWMTQDFWVCDTAEARKDFDYNPTISLKEGISRTLRWAQESQKIN